MRLGDGLEVLEISMDVMNQHGVIYPTLLWDDSTMVLVDTGIPGKLDEIKNSIENVGLSFNKLNKIVLTHQDFDHVGSAAEIVRSLDNNIEVISHDIERPYINGEKTPVKLAQLEASLKSSPDPLKEAMLEKLMSGFSVSKVDIDTTVSDGEVLPYCGGITVIFTPGHTPGHICLYHGNSKTLITGDALTLSKGKLEGPKPGMTADITAALKSLEKLTKYDIKKVICYHGGVYENNNVNKEIAELAKIY